MFFICEGLATAIKILAGFNLVETIAFRKKRAIPIMILCIMMGTVIDVANIITAGDMESLTVLITVQSIQSICTFFVYTGSKRLKASIIFLSWMLVTYIDYFIQISVYVFSGGIEWLLTASIYRGIYIIVSAVVFLGITIKIKKWTEKNSNIWNTFLGNSYRIILLLMVCAIYFHRIYALRISDLPEHILGLIGQMALLIVLIVSYLIFKEVRHQSAEQQKNLNVKMEMLERQYAALESVYEEKSILLHDMKNHLRTIDQMVSLKEIQEANEYIERLIGGLEKEGIPMYTNHKMVDLILATKKKEAENYHISFQCEGDDLSNLCLLDSEICSLFSNLLDNALEAARKCDEGVVSVICRRRGNMLIIIMMNSTEEELRVGNNTELLSSKMDKKFHGYGLKSVQHVLEQHEGYMKFETKQKTVTVSVTLRGFNSTR